MAAMFIGVIVSALGAGYMMYGKRMARFAPLVCGLGLCVVPWFVDSVTWLCVIGGALAAAPFLVDF